MRLKAVIFDAEGTLLHIHPSVGAVYARVLSDFGYQVEPFEIDHRIRKLWPTFRNYFADFSRRGCLQAWRRIFCETVSPWVNGERREELFRETYEAFARPEAFRLAPGTKEALEFLHAQGIKTAILSNWDERLFRLLEAFGLSGAFERVLVACELGVGKPSPEAFRLACEALGVRPEEALMVGNDPRDDFEGARRAGLKAWLYRGEDLYEILRREVMTGATDGRVQRS